ncbi:GTP cyclohydrolase II/3,4-dihydroxy 2-butanone 4-phosphate synthase/GTP cyclohydrolase II [Williamsia limnetica]|uniref:GTP cyclohydrolase-2 n=1 Tax=Williamsia limnetica TaxID=882452 RepID=A0A318RTV3_WILLI|nr:3,4-dihydroxy-2-butanone-4-phosphate synthase [Williamsia limnetica]PYE19438.1 GTP cyclohydrolase II/3,4-dihydroxy 2-butanone 4-phosphate synthase/GTP cyclohydrolase II [Williamsia limnetica]
MSDLTTVAECLQQLRLGRPVIVVDDESRENEADLVMAAEFATVDNIAFFLDHTSGFLCVAMPQSRTIELGLPQMVTDPTDPLGTAFTVSVDAVAGVTTGISAGDRAQTIRVLAAPEAVPADFTRPGHVMPLRARDGGVLERRGHTEAAVDLCAEAGLEPVGVICEIISADRREMLSRGDVGAFAQRHGLAMITIEQLVAHRRAGAISRGAQCRLPTDRGLFETIAYQSATGSEHLALVNGDLRTGTPLVRVHSECLTGDTLGSRRCDCGDQLRTAMSEIAAADSGVLIYLGGHEGRGIGLSAKIAAYRLQDLDGLDTVDANLRLGMPVDGRDYRDAAAILHDLGAGRIRLLTNNPAKSAALRELGIDVAEVVGLEIEATADNLGYLATKRDRLGHHLLPEKAVI